MTESKPSPSSPEPGVVVAEPGKLDVEPQTKETPTEAAAEPSEGGKTKAEGDGGTERQEMQQQIARLERQIRNMSSYAQLGLAVAQDDKGKSVVDRWQRGEELFGSEAAGEYSDEGPQSSSLTEEKLHRLLDTREAARRQMDELNSMAAENLEHFDKVRRSQKFTKALDGALHTIWNDPNWYDDAPKEVRDWDDEVAAKNYTAIVQAHRYVLANNPKVLEALKEAGKKEAKEKAEAALAASVSSGGTSSSQEEPPPKSEEQEILDRMVNAGQGGRISFSKVARKP